MSSDGSYGLKELAPPPQAFGKLDATEVLRCWIIDGRLVVAVKPLAFGEELESWGMLFADAGRHVANAAEKEGVASYVDCRKKMWRTLSDEWKRPTGPATTTEVLKQ